ncbi:multiple sugar transport system permease protein [Candidatus Hakubella thermalkaliphila]|nr:multiple sugar transport system permease protein [Candidatus Hakubella thermalkaliphila]
MAMLKQAVEADTRAATQTHKKLSRDRLEEIVVGYLFLLPDVLGLLVFVVGPMLFAFYVSLNKWDGFTTAEFIGVKNYAVLLRDQRFVDSLLRTVKYTLGFVPTAYVLSLTLALLLNRKAWGSTFFRTSYFMPVAISLVVASIVWRFMFAPSYGFLNFVLQTFGLPKSQWLGSVQTAMFSILIVTIWKPAGYFMIILLAGIQDIPREYFEAAIIDSAGPWALFRYIIMPLLKPTSFFVIAILTINSLQAFDQIYVLTRGGPAYSTYTLLMYIYEQAFRFWRFGHAAAMSFVLFGIILILTLIQLHYFRAGEAD